jgi:hypothetical protein
VAYGLDNGVWTSPMIAWVMEEEFGIKYHPGHVRKLLHAWVTGVNHSFLSTTNKFPYRF